MERERGTVNTKLERHVQWYPGHMAKALRRIREYLRAIDVVIEVVDARIARSGRNPVLDELAAEKRRVVVLDRDDLAEPGDDQALAPRVLAARLYGRCGRRTKPAQRRARCRSDLAGAGAPQGAGRSIERDDPGHT